ARRQQLLVLQGSLPPDQGGAHQQGRRGPLLAEPAAARDEPQGNLHQELAARVPPKSMRSRCALLLLLAAAAAGAAEQPEPAADSITATKKDLATVKALGAPVEGASALPSVDMKAISPGPGAARVDAPAALPADDEASLDPSKRKDKEGTGNWLVDAMDKKSGRER